MNIEEINPNPNSDPIFENLIPQEGTDQMLNTNRIEEIIFQDNQNLEHQENNNIGQTNSALSNNQWRAKLYHLNGDGNWDDYGAGQFSIVQDVQFPNLFF